ncbi:MAG: diguanylate cyclase, partial [Sphingomonadales bacterium]|nr:diguanylate cyclase [Sphingomonadales bacterium]
NDGRGHIAGDCCLKRIGGALKAIGARPRDIAARYGGEEFVLLLPETDAKAALHLAEQVQQAIADLAITHGHGHAGAVVTASIGVGTVLPARGSDSASFVEAVDRLLYTAKQNGRDRIEAARL